MVKTILINKSHKIIEHGTLPKRHGFSGLTGWKKAVRRDNNNDYVIVKLLICPRTEVVMGGAINLFGRPTGVINKCRAASAKVLAIEQLDGTKLDDSIVAYSLHDKSFQYKVGKRVRAKKGKFDGSSLDQCGIGIHFFVNRIDAEKY